jgi:hypothetical protein
MKYRKKVLVDGEQFVVYKSDMILSFAAHGVTYPVYEDDKGIYLIIPSLEGNHRFDNLDWILKGIEGEFWAVKPDIFEKTYEKVE